MSQISNIVELVDAGPPATITRRVMVQRWTDVVFLHWADDPEVVQRLLPAGVAVDLFDGRPGSGWCRSR